MGVGSIWGLGAGDVQYESGRPSGIMKPRRADRRGGDEQNGAFGGGAGATDAANPMRAAQ